MKEFVPISLNFLSKFTFLKDVLENDSIKLDRMFKFSLVQDLVRVCKFSFGFSLNKHCN